MISDRLLVRKPIMFLGAGIVVISMIFVMTAHEPSYWRLAIPLMCWSLGMGGGFSPWFAAYSEDAEALNPALVGTVFAVFGVSNRLSVVIAGLVIPEVVGTEAGWRTWFVISAVMMLAYIPLCAYGLAGQYSPRRARAALESRSRAIRAGFAGVPEPARARTPSCRRRSRPAEPARSGPVRGSRDGAAPPPQQIRSRTPPLAPREPHRRWP